MKVKNTIFHTWIMDTVLVLSKNLGLNFQHNTLGQLITERKKKHHTCDKNLHGLLVIPLVC